MHVGRCLSAWKRPRAPPVRRSVLLSEESNKILLVRCTRSAPGAAAGCEHRAPNAIAPIFWAVHGMAAHTWALAGGGVRGQRGHGTASRAANAAAPELSCLQKDTQPQRAPLMAERTVAAPAASNPTVQLSRATEQSPCRFPCDAEREDPTQPAAPPPAPQLPAPSC